jgi:hypothetical protein
MERILRCCRHTCQDSDVRSRARGIGQLAYCGGNVYFVLQTAGVGAPFVMFTMSQCGFLFWQLLKPPQ